MAQNEMRAMRRLPLRVRLSEGLGVVVEVRAKELRKAYEPSLNVAGEHAAVDDNGPKFKGRL
jgi:hypothetical protein